MRKVILNLAVSIDGFIEDRNGGFDWCFTDQDYFDGQFERFDTVLMGRKSFEVMVKMNEMPMHNMDTYIFSDTLTSTEYGTVIDRKNSAAKVMELKSREGQDIWFFGGADLLTEFFEKHLIDELQLAVHPIMLGSGKRLFQGKLAERKKCRLISSKPYETGLVMLKYQVLSEKSH